MVNPRRFELHRDSDVHGVSGEGHVADGVLWHDGAVTLRWRGSHPSTANWDAPNGLEHATAVHGHGGRTRVVWLDQTASAGTVAAQTVVHLAAARPRSPFRHVTAADLKRLCAAHGLTWDQATNLPGPLLHQLIDRLDA